jgi:primosomal protein N''
MKREAEDETDKQNSEKLQADFDRHLFHVNRIGFVFIFGVDILCLE